MARETDATHDPELRSWVASANDPQTDFPIQNLPFGVFVRHGGPEPVVGTAIGDQVVDLAALAGAGLFDDVAPELAEVFGWWSLNPFLWEGPGVWRGVRRRLSELLREGTAELADDADLQARALVPMTDVEMLEPVEVGDYTDFYASIHHATNVGSMFRPDNPLLPNYKHIPVGYHGRASSIVVGGTPIVRPKGQSKADDADAPTYGPCRLLDYELEVAAFVGVPNELGEPIAIEHAEEHLFGIALCNDWSARDVQKWEYQPLGPFLAKSFATSVGPWVVTLDALAPFRCPAFVRPEGDPRPLPHLLGERDQAAGGVDLTLEVSIATAQMRDAGMPPHRVSRGRFADMYWTLAQMLAHHASNGCNMQVGDMFASGTVSGPDEDARGCLLERTWRGTNPIELPTGEQRRFLEDGDEVVLSGFCERDGQRRIGLGTCSGVVRPAPA